VPSAGFLKLDLYADRLQRAMLSALSRLRREQDRAAKTGDTAAGAADAEVELGVDTFEDATMSDKPTAEEEEDREPLDLRVFIRDPYAKENAEEGGAANHSNSQNKATAAAEAPPAQGGANGAREGEAPAEPRAAARREARPPGRGESNQGGDAPEPWRDVPPWHPMRKVAQRSGG
jgi:hypothetical protein